MVVYYRHYGTELLSRKIGNKLPTDSSKYPTRFKISRHSCQSLQSSLISVYSKNLTKLINALCERSQDLLMLNLAVCKVTTGLQMLHISLMKCYKARSCALCKVRCSLWHRHYMCMYLNNSNKCSRTSTGTQCSVQMGCSHSRLLL